MQGSREGGTAVKVWEEAALSLVCGAPPNEAKRVRPISRALQCETQNGADSTDVCTESQQAFDTDESEAKGEQTDAGEDLAAAGSQDRTGRDPRRLGGGD